MADIRSIPCEDGDWVELNQAEMSKDKILFEAFGVNSQTDQTDSVMLLISVPHAQLMVRILQELIVKCIPHSADMQEDINVQHTDPDARARIIKNAKSGIRPPSWAVPKYPSTTGDKDRHLTLLPSRSGNNNSEESSDG